MATPHCQCVECKQPQRPPQQQSFIWMDLVTGMFGARTYTATQPSSANCFLTIRWWHRHHHPRSGVHWWKRNKLRSTQDVRSRRCAPGVYLEGSRLIQAPVWLLSPLSSAYNNVALFTKLEHVSRQTSFRDDHAISSVIKIVNVEIIVLNRFRNFVSHQSTFQTHRPQLRRPNEKETSYKDLISFSRATKPQSDSWQHIAVEKS